MLLRSAALSMFMMLAAPLPAAPVTALVGATLIDGTGSEPVNDAVVLVEGKHILCAGTREACPVPEHADTVDLSGRFITPGLVDAHVHYSQTGWADGRPDSLDVREQYPYAKTQAALQANPDRWHRSHLCSGVTAVYDVGGYPWTWDVRAPSRGNPDAPRYAAAGPLLTTLDHWLNLPAERQFIYLDEESAAREGVDYLAAFDTDAVKLWFINTGERPMAKLEAIARAAGERAAELGLPFIVHATGLAEAEVAVAAGADLLVHSVGDQRLSDELVDGIIEGDVIYTPTLTVRDGYYRLFQSAIAGEPPAIDDPHGCVDAALRERIAATAEMGHLTGERDAGWLEDYRARLERGRRTMDANLRRLSDAGATIATGTDAGNPLTLHGAAINTEMEAMQAAGMSPMQVIVASTRDAAKAMGAAQDTGTLEAGKSADLLVLSANPAEDVAHFRELESVMRAGVLRHQESLRAR